MDGTALAERLQEKVAGVCLIVAPLLLAASSFLEGTDGMLYAAGFVGVVAFFCFIAALQGIAGMLRHGAPRLAVIGGLVATAGGVGGVAFEAAILHEWAARTAGTPEAGVAAILEVTRGRVFPALLLFGIQFALSLLILGVGLFRTGVAPRWVPALMIAGALLFPVGHIGRIALFMHLADLCLAIPLIWFGLRFLSGARPMAVAVPATA